MSATTIKGEARCLIDRLPHEATWEDIEYAFYVRSRIEAGLKDSREGRTVTLAEVRRRFGLESHSTEAGRVSGLKIRRIADERGSTPGSRIMPTTMKSLGIDRLPVDERLDLIEEIWDNITSEFDSLPLTPAQETEIARRLDEHDTDPDDVIPWVTIKAESDARFAR